MPGQKFGPAWFPGLVAGGLGLCGIGLALSGARPGGPWLALPDWVYRSRPRAAVAALIGGLLFYILLIDMVGFHLTGTALLALWIRVLGGGWRVAVPVALLAPILVHLAFYKALRVPLPWGLLERWAF